MTAGRYDLAAEAPIMNTYVPINFGELYRIGTALKLAVDEATKEMSGAISTFGEFQSPSLIDTDTYYKNTIGRLSDLVEEASRNPDAMKDAGFRAKFQQRINNLDYSTLSRLKQSREGLLTRLKINQELMMRGMYNPAWHNVDFANYDTTSGGVFNDISPLAYKSEVDLVKPFVDNLKASFMGVKNGWIHQGVSTERTDQEIQKNLSSIQNTPEYKKHLEVLQNQGLSREDAELQLNNTLITAGREFAYDLAERDPWWIKSMELLARYGGKDESKLNNLTTVVHKDAARTFLSNFSGLNVDALNKYMNQGIASLNNEEKQQLANNMNIPNIRTKLLNGFRLVAKESKNINAGANYVLDVMSSPLSYESADIYSKTGTTGKKLGEGEYLAADSRNFQLADNLAYSMLGTTRAAIIGGSNNNKLLAKGIISRNKFEKEWNNGGKFHDFIIKGDTRTVTDGNKVYHLKYAYIPVDQFNDYSAEERALIGGKLVKLGNIDTSTTFRDNDGTYSTSTNKRDKTLEYVRVPVTTVIPNEGEAAITSDALWDNARGLSQKLTDTQNRLSEYERNY